MADPLHRSDVEKFDAYPSGPQLADDPNRLLPEQTAPSSQLEEYGAQLGSAAGKAVVAIRRTREKVRDMTAQKSAKVTDIASARIEDATARLQDVRDQAGARAEQLGRTAREQLFELRRQTRNGLYRARLRAREVQKHYPVHVVIGAGVTGLVIGALLRIWRSNRA